MSEMSDSTGLIKLYPFQQIRYEEGLFFAENCVTQDPHILTTAKEVCNWLNSMEGVGLYLDYDICDTTGEHTDLFLQEADRRHYHYIIPNRHQSQVNVSCLQARESGAIISVRHVERRNGLTAHCQKYYKEIKGVVWY
jgi:hypothetical protein